MLDSTVFENEAGRFARRVASRDKRVDADELYTSIVDKFNHIARHNEETAIDILRHVSVESFAKGHGLVPDSKHERGMSL